MTRVFTGQIFYQDLGINNFAIFAVQSPQYSYRFAPCHPLPEVGKHVCIMWGNGYTYYNSSIVNGDNNG